MSTPTFTPRPAQAQILAYEGGHMGISAVPGSGKTFTLSLLAAQLVQHLTRVAAPDDREVLIVTFSNSAVENFRSRIRGFLHQETKLLATVGYRVRTLHSLAMEIVRERPGLVGLGEDISITDERTSLEIKRESVNAFLRTHPDALSPSIRPEYLARFQTIKRFVEDDALEIANTLIRIAKEQSLDPYQLQNALRKQAGTWPLLELGLHVYADYQRSLRVRGAVDFDDMIALAIKALDADAGFLARLQARWPYVLEDEAQDSSRLQEELLRRLTASHGNWVRVGDPNQSINTTFTGANTRYLRDFVAENPALARELPNSGRSAHAIIDLANRLIDWSNRRQAGADEASEPLTLPLIEPTPAGDPQPNPAAGEPPVYFHDMPLTSEREVEMVVKSVARWLPEHPDATAAILVLENEKAHRVMHAVKQAGLPVQDDLLRMSDASRATASALAITLNYIADPDRSRTLLELWREVWWPLVGIACAARLSGAPADAQTTAALRWQTRTPEVVEQFGLDLQRGEPERFVFPVAQDWPGAAAAWNESELFPAVVDAFRAHLQRWTHAAVLPIDELLLTIGNDLFTEPSQLALTHYLATELGKLVQENDALRLPELAAELENVVNNRRRLVNFPDGSSGYEAQPGKVTIATMHGAKGLEWDRVYLMGVNSYSFPSGGDDVKYRSERWFVRDSLNLVAEAAAQLRQLAGGTLDDYIAGQATRQARRDLAAERLRLLYVGITRARKELLVTYNTGRNAEKEPLGPADAFVALKHFSTQPAA